MHAVPCDGACRVIAIDGRVASLMTTELTATSLPPEVVRLLALHMPWADTLSARAACQQWASALTPLIKKLRVHAADDVGTTVAAPVSTVLPESSSDEPLGTLEHAPEGSSGCSQMSKQSTAAVAAKLHAFLEQLPGLQSVTLVLSKHTTAQCLQTVLKVLALQRVPEIILSEAASLDSMPRSYTSGLCLAELQHVQVLKIRTLWWSLSDIWQQVALMGSPCNDDGGSSSSSTDKAGSGPQLHTLIIEPAPVPCHPTSTLACCMPARDALAHVKLQHLITPLPGLFDSSSGVVCSLLDSQSAYIEELAARFPQLLSLRIVGSYQGHVDRLERFREVEQLEVMIGTQFRPDIVSADDPENPIRCLAKSLGKLKSLHFRYPEMLSPPDLSRVRDSVRLDVLSEAPQLQHLGAALLQAQQDVRGAAGNLRSLVGQSPTMTTEFMSQVAALGQGLTSLSLSSYGTRLIPLTPRDRLQARTFIPMQQQLATLTNLRSLSLVAHGRQVLTLQDPPAVWQQLKCLRHVRLQNVWLPRGSSPDSNTQHVGDHSSGSRGRLVLWLHQLPLGQLLSLELSGYIVALSHNLDHSCSLTIGAACCPVGEQQQLGVSSNPTQSAAHPGSTASSSGSREPALERLVLVDCACVYQEDPCGTDNMVRGLLPKHRMRLSPEEAEALPPGFRQGPIHCLLSVLGQQGKLQQLQLLHGTLVSAADVAYIANSGLGAHLQQLSIETDIWDVEQRAYLPPSGRLETSSSCGDGSNSSQLRQQDQQQDQQQQQQDQAGEQQAAAAVVQQQPCSLKHEWLPGMSAPAILAAAFCSGKLPLLRDLSLLLSVPDDSRLGRHTALGVDALGMCAELTRLQKLSLAINPSVYGIPAPGTPACGTSNAGESTFMNSADNVRECACGSGTSTAWPQLDCWQHLGRLSNLQQLQVAVKLVVPVESCDLVTPGTATRDLGRCKSCGGMVGTYGLWQFLTSGAPEVWPGCDIICQFSDI